MKKLIATLLIICGVITATTFGSQAKLEATINCLSITPARAEYQASYPIRTNQMVMTINMLCRYGRNWAQNVTDNTKSVNTVYSVSLNAKNRSFGPIQVYAPDGSHTVSLRIIVNGQTLIM